MCNKRLLAKQQDGTSFSSRDMKSLKGYQSIPVNHRTTVFKLGMTSWKRFYNLRLRSVLFLIEFQKITKTNLRTVLGEIPEGTPLEKAKSNSAEISRDYTEKSHPPKNRGSTSEGIPRNCLEELHKTT